MAYDLTKGGIYSIVNTVNLKHYIGSAVILKQRWATHRTTLTKGNHRNTHLQNAWKKYGTEAFEFSVIEYVDDPTQLTKIEQLYLDGCWSSGKLYNISPTAESVLGVRRSEETRHRISNKHIGQKAWNKGKTDIYSEETRRNMSQHMKGRVSPQKGKHPSEETRLRQSAAKKGKSQSETAVINRSAYWLVTFPDGHQEQVVNLAAFCRNHNLSDGTLGCRGHYKGFKAVKLTPTPTVVVVSVGS